MPTLIELSTEIERLETALSEIDEGHEQDELIAQYLQSKSDLKTKIDHYAALISELESRSEIRKQEAKRLSDRSRVDANLAAKLKSRLLWYLQEHEVNKLETKRYSINRQKAGGKLPLIINENCSPADLPQRFQEVSVEFNKDSIREALLHGEELDFACLGIRQEIIRIK